MSDQDGYRGERNDPYSDGRTGRRSESPRGDGAANNGWEGGAPAAAGENGGAGSWEGNDGSAGQQGGNWENNDGGRARAEEVQRGREGSENVNQSNLHVSGLAPKIDHEELIRFFGAIGPVEKASVMYDPHTKESRGFGFVMMKTHEDAMKAIAELDNKEFMGKCLRIQVARRARARTPTPGRYFGPPKALDGPPPRGGGRYDERPYTPRSYDSRYGAPGGRGYDDRERGHDRYDRRYDDRRERDYRSYDDRPRYDERPRYDDRPPRDSRDYASRDAPRDVPRDVPRGGYDDRRAGGYDRPRY